MLEALAKKTRAGRVPSLLFIAEDIDQHQPLYGLVGRLRADPARAIGYLAIMKLKVTEFAASQGHEFEGE